ncbi:MAG TPA: ECF transporter S component [Eubacteriaceae bacterium]|nr:ECF transporter S component [Eubacteriaceae bacterium]
MDTKKLVWIAMFVALSFVGAQLKIFQSIAFDSMPAFAAALLLGPVSGALVGFIGHLLTALSSGFPFSLPVHLTIAVTMAFICFVFGYLKDRIPIGFNVLIATLFNGLGATAVSVAVMVWFGVVPSFQGMFMTLVMPLTLASFVNVFLAAALSKAIEKAGVKQGSY